MNKLADLWRYDNDYQRVFDFVGYNVLKKKKKKKEKNSGSSILIRQHYALFYNFDLRFVEICLVFLIFLKTGSENLK